MTNRLVYSLQNILSGILISIGAYAYLKVGGPIGSLLFAFGIITIVKLHISLFTGVAGTDLKFKDKMNVLTWNILGAIAGGVFVGVIGDSAVNNSILSLVDNKIIVGVNPFIIFIKAVFCGIIVDVAVHISKRDNSVIALLIGIPVFILSGFYHSIADSAYYGIYLVVHNWDYTVIRYLVYLCIVILGNFVGCNIRRVLIGLK